MNNPRQQLWERWAHPPSIWEVDNLVLEVRMWNLMEPLSSKDAHIKYRPKGQSLVRLSREAFFAAIAPYEHIGPCSSTLDW